MHVKKVSLLWSNKRNPAKISSSESLIVIALENGLQNMFKVNKKDNRTTLLPSFWCLYF